MSELKNKLRLSSETPKSNRTTNLRAISNASGVSTRISRPPSRLPVRSQSLSLQKCKLQPSGVLRATSPSPSPLARSVTPKSDSLSTDNASKPETEKPKTNCKPKFEPRINKTAQQRINRSNALTVSGPPSKPTFRNVTSIASSAVANRRKLANANSMPNNHGDSLASATPPTPRPLEPNSARSLEAQHKKLQDFQSEFMRELSQQGRMGQHNFGEYKFVALVMNESCELVVSEDNLVGLPKFLPAESVYDLKERCRRMVDAGFAMMYENLASIHKAKDVFEANAARDDLLSKMQIYLKREISTLSTEIDRMCGLANGKLNDLQRELNEVRGQKSQLDSRFEDIKKEHTSAITKLQQEHEKSMTQLHQEQEKAITHLRQEHKKAISLETEKRDKIIADLEKSLHKLEKDKEQLELSIKNERGDTLSPLRSDTLVEVMKRDEIIADLRQTLHIIQKEKKLLEKRYLEVKNLKEVVDKRDETIASLNQALLTAGEESVKSEKASMEHKNLIDKMRRDYALNMSKETGKRDNTISELKASLRESEEGMKHFKCLFTELKDQQVELVAQLEQMEVMPSETEKRDKILAELNKSLRKTRYELENHAQALAEKMPLSKEDQETVQRLRLEAEKLKTMNISMQYSLERANAGLERSRRYIADNEERISFLEYELKEARDLRSNLLEDRPANVTSDDITIPVLRAQVNSLEQHRNVLNDEIKKITAQHLAFDNLNMKFKESQKDISDLKQKLNYKKSQLMKRTEAELELRNELNLSKDELTKFEIQVARLNEQLERDRQLLLVRSEMINALQKHDEENRQKLDEMYSQLNKKNLLVTKMNDRLTSKDEEFRNLFGTLSSKQKEVSRLEHIIRLLEDNNDRGSMLRVKQEERNAAMQDEIINLRKSMREYAKIIIGNSGQTCFEIVTAGEVVNHFHSGKESDKEEEKHCCDDNCKFHKYRQTGLLTLAKKAQPEGERNKKEQDEQKKKNKSSETSSRPAPSRLDNSRNPKTPPKLDNDLTVLLEPKFRGKSLKKN